MSILLIVIFGLFGAAVGSFLNVCIDRLPSGKSLISPPSYCDSCRKRVPLRDLVPVFSYLLLRGRCRYCNARIPMRVFWVELGTTLLFALTTWHFGPGAQLGVTLFYFCLFIVIGVIDLEHKLILNKIVYPTAVVALLIDAFLSPQNIIGGLVNGIIGAAIGFFFLLIVAILSRGGMGFGDVKMAGLIGLAVGFPQTIVALLLGILAGGLVAAGLLVSGVKKRKEGIPFGPFLSLGTIAALIWGNAIVNWYLTLFRI